MPNLFVPDSARQSPPEDSKAAVLELQDLRKSFGSRAALQGITLTIEETQQVALLGPNGAGKTTLVRTICGRCKPDSGSVTLFGKPITKPGSLDDLGVVPQDLAIYGDLTAKENLLIFGRLHGLQGRALKKRVEWALEWIGLSDRGNSLVKTFSGGMKRRVNIASGVLHAPKLLLLDEPTVGVDPQSRQRIFDMCDELVAQGTTIILTTHQLDEAETRCDRIVIVDHGTIVADGTLEDLIEDTVGNTIHLTFVVQDINDDSIPGLHFLPESNCYYATTHDPSYDIPQFIDTITDLGGSVVDMQMQRSDLNQVFLHLTGRELRE
jgi:ABC-2 type transport system ATP-binding protein